MRKRWFTSQLFPSHQDSTKGVRAIEIADPHAQAYSVSVFARNRTFTSDDGCGAGDNPHRSPDFRISLGPKAKALGHSMI